MKLRLVTTFQKALMLPIQLRLNHLRLKMIQLRVKLSPLPRKPAVMLPTLRRMIHLPLMTAVMTILMTTVLMRMMRMMKMTRTMKTTRMMKMILKTVMMVMMKMMAMTKMMAKTKMMVMMSR